MTVLPEDNLPTTRTTRQVSLPVIPDSFHQESTLVIPDSFYRESSLFARSSVCNAPTRGFPLKTAGMTA